MRLDSRLMACAELVRPNKTVADIGTDHALLPCFLWQSGKSRDIIASDVKPGPLKCARKTLERYGIEIEDGVSCENGVKLILSDGFESLPPCDDVIIAGMGGETILEILSSSKPEHRHEDARFILQPMTRQDKLRAGLSELGFEIISESDVYSKKKHYTIIYARFKS